LIGRRAAWPGVVGRYSCVHGDRVTVVVRARGGAVTGPAAVRCARAITCCTGDVEKESGVVQLSQDMVRRVSPDAGMVWPLVWEAVVVRARDDSEARGYAP